VTIASYLDFNHTNFDPEHGGSMFFRKICIHQKEYTAHPIYALATLKFVKTNEVVCNLKGFYRALLKRIVFWYMRLCNLRKVCFASLHGLVFVPENEVSSFIRNVFKFLPVYLASYLRS
jgi:hypothetical protein